MQKFEECVGEWAVVNEKRVSKFEFFLKWNEVSGVGYVDAGVRVCGDV